MGIGDWISSPWGSAGLGFWMGGSPGAAAGYGIHEMTGPGYSPSQQEKADAGLITQEHADWLNNRPDYMQQGGFVDQETGEPVMQDAQGNFVDKNGQIITDPERFRNLTRQSIMMGRGHQGPAAPQFQSYLTQKGTLPEQYEMQSALEPYLFQDPGKGYKAFEEYALSPEESMWAKTQRDKLDLEALAEKEKMGQSIGSQLSTQRSQMAMMGGGLRGGQRERLGESALRQERRGTQDIARQRMLGGLDIGSQEYASKIAALSRLPGMEEGRRQFDVSMWAQGRGSDIDRALRERERQDLLAQRQYETKMQELGARSQAQLEASMMDT